MSACALTGHRTLGEEFSPARLRRALESLLKEGTDTFYCGMAMGFDLAAGELLVRLRKKYPLRLVACIPCADQAERFPLSLRRRYEALLSACDERVVLFPAYEKGCMFARNRYMVDRADCVLAYLTAPQGGTYYTVRYAEKKGVPVLYL